MIILCRFEEISKLTHYFVCIAGNWRSEEATGEKPKRYSEYQLFENLKTICSFNVYTICNNKPRGVFTNQSNIYDGAFLWK